MPTITIGQNSTNDVSGLVDTDVRDNGGAINTNDHTATTCFVSKYATGDFRTHLFRVTGLSNVPPGSTVTGATYFHKQVAGSVDPITFTFKRMKRMWVIDQATGNDYATSTAWTAVMGVGNGTDRETTVTLAQAVDLTLSGYTSFTSAQFITDTQFFVDNPSTNYGWDIERTDGADDTGYREFISSNGADGDRPYLEVVYTAGAVATHRNLLLMGCG